MNKLICIYEDNYFENLLPLVYTRPVYNLKCGILSIYEKMKYRLPKAKFILHSRKYLEPALNFTFQKTLINTLPDDNILFINGRVLLASSDIKFIVNLQLDTIVLSNNEIVIANLSKSSVLKLKNNATEFYDFNSIELKKVERVFKVVKYPWDLINENGNQITEDFKLMKKNKKSAVQKSNVHITNKQNVFIEKNAEIAPFVHLDASEGPIFISSQVKILSHTYIQGPAFIGKGSLVKGNTSIYHNTSVGEFCKIGGEVENSIIHSYSNKQHEGFLGHAYLGSWVNLGANTNNSDLKNNYSNISVLLNGKTIDTGCRFVGLIMGDHSKTAISTIFNTGTIVGVSCNIFGSGFPPRFIPSFSWGGSAFIKNYSIDKCIEVAKIVYQRRGIEFSKVDEELLTYLYENTKTKKNSNG